MNKKKPLIMIGGGGHASVLADILMGQGREIIAVISPDSISERPIFDGIAHFQSDDAIEKFSSSDVKLVNGVGFLPRSPLRKKLYQRYTAQGYEFETIIASDASISSYASIASGAQVLTRGIVQTGATIGENTIINTGALVEHDCYIAAHNHIAPKAVLCGQVTTGEGVFIGANATILQNISIKNDAVVAAGATLTMCLDKNTTHYPIRSTEKYT
ncbi:shikimate dehydrogenase [Salinivibrio kushneri]|nr:shikimate dehydrogenase [Salinivibrio kushneri]